MTSNPSIIDASRIACSDAEVVPLPPTDVYASISFVMQEQCYSNWCWAASAASVAAYYDANTPWQQCTIAIKELHRPDCCQYPCHQDSRPFNVINTLGSPLHRVRRLATVKFRQALRQEVRQELSSKRPVCARSEWQGGGSHFIVIAAYSEISDKLSVYDSLYGFSHMLFDRFCDSYWPGRGQWTHSYFTKPAN